MSVNSFESKCQTYSNKKLFGICDDPSPAKNPAYIDEKNGVKWIAIVVNEYLYETTFTAIDNCIDIEREDGKQAKRCDGVLTHDTTVIFIELKQRGGGRKWVRDGEEQLRVTISYFEKSDAAENYTTKRAYIANSEHPKFRSAQAIRMQKFLDDTGYILRIENRIILD